MPEVNEKSKIAAQMAAAMATNSASFGNDFKVDLIPRVRNGKGILSPKQRMMMRLAEEEKAEAAPPNIPDGDDFEDAIEGARREREPTGPPLAIQFPTTNDDVDDDGGNQFPILSSPSSLSWHTFKVDGNDPPWHDVDQHQAAMIEGAANKAVKEVGADRGDDMEKDSSTAAPDHLTEDSVISVFGQDSVISVFGQESVISVFGQEKKKPNDFERSRSNDLSIMTEGPEEEEKEDERGRKLRRVNEDIMEAVMAPSAAVPRSFITNEKEEKIYNTKGEIIKKREEIHKKEETIKPQIRKVVTTTTASKERRTTTNNNGRKSNNVIISSTSTTNTTANNPKKERVGFASRMLKKKTRLSTLRRNKDAASIINNKKAAPLASIAADDDDDDDGKALLGSAAANNTNTHSSSREKSSFLNLRGRVRMLGKSRQSKRNSKRRGSKNVGKQQQQQHLGKIKEEPEVLPATPVRKKSNSGNAVDKIKEEVPEPVSEPVPEQQAVPSTPIKQKSNADNNDDEASSFHMATIIVTPVRVSCSDITTHPDTFEKQAGKGASSPTASDTPTTTTSAASLLNLSPHYDTSPRNGGTRKVQDTDSNGHPMMLPPAMPPSMVSCKTMDDRTVDNESSTSVPNPMSYSSPSWAAAQSVAGGDIQGLEEEKNALEEEDGDLVQIKNSYKFSAFLEKKTAVAKKNEDVDGDLARIKNSYKFSAFLEKKAAISAASSKPKKMEDVVDKALLDDDCYTDITEKSPVVIETARNNNHHDDTNDTMNDTINANDDDDEDDPSIHVVYDDDDHGIIGTSTDVVIVEVSSTTQDEGGEEEAFCEDIEVIKCMGMEDIWLENIRSRDNNDDANYEDVNEDEVEDKVEQDSLKQSSKTTKESATTKETMKTKETQESEVTHNTNATRGRGRLGRSKIRAAAMSSMMNVRNNNNNNGNGGEGNRNRSKSRDAKHRNRSKSRDNGGRTRSKSISKRTRRFREKNQVNGGDTDKDGDKNNGKKSENNNDAVASSSSNSVRTPNTKSGNSARTTTGLSNEANEALARKEENSINSHSYSPAALREMEQLVITPVSTPTLGSHKQKGYRSLSQQAQAVLAAPSGPFEAIEVGRKKDSARQHGLSQKAKHVLAGAKDAVDDLEEIEVSFGIGGAEAHSNVKKMRRESKIVVSKKQQLQQHVRGSNSRSARSEKSILDTGDFTGDYTSEEELSYETPDDESTYGDQEEDNDSDYYDDDDDDTTASDDDDESDSFVSRKSSYSQESDDATTCAGFQEEIMEDLHDAFVDTTAHITQMMNVFDISERFVAGAKSFDISEGLVAEAQNNSRREERRASRAAAKKKHAASSRKKRGDEKKRGESGQSRRTRPRISNEHDGHSDDHRSGSGEQQLQRRARGGRSDEKKNKEKKNTAKRSSRFRKTEL